VESLVRSGRDAHLVLAGAGTELANLQQIVKNSVHLNGRVHFVGFTDQAQEYLNVMDVFVQASHAEGMSNTLLEAMGTGLPLVATRVGGNPELIVNGKNGFLFEAQDGRALEGHLQKLIDSEILRNEMGACSRERAIREFSVARMLEQYRNLYQKLAVRRGVLAASEV
jgi:glycosyltransferase involved in cell wall biosynthesis